MNIDVSVSALDITLHLEDQAFKPEEIQELINHLFSEFDWTDDNDYQRRVSFTQVIEAFAEHLN